MSPATLNGQRSGRSYKFFLRLLWLSVVAVTLYFGAEYYATPILERPDSELHELLKPSGTIGLAYGIVGTLLMILGVFAYVIRKRVELLAEAGKLTYWLKSHIFLCTMGPYLVLLHTGFKIGGIVSIAFWCMVAVVLSGFFGRYVYVRLPKTINGTFLSIRNLQQRREALVQAVREKSGLRPSDVDQILYLAYRRSPRGVIHALFLALWYDLTRRSLRRKIDRFLAAHNVPQGARAPLIELAEREISLEQQVVLLRPFHRLFGYWHVFHLPLATVMFLIMTLHIAVAVLFGYAWVF